MADIYRRIREQEDKSARRVSTKFAKKGTVLSHCHHGSSPGQVTPLLSGMEQEACMGTRRIDSDQNLKTCKTSLESGVLEYCTLFMDR